VAGLSQLPAADLVVARDGMNSQIRCEAGRFGTDVYRDRNKYGWLGTGKVFKSFMYAFVCTCSGWVWACADAVDAETRSFIVECSPETWESLGSDTMPPQDSCTLLTNVFECWLDGHRLFGQRCNDTRVSWSIFRTATNQHWFDGKFVLAGNAAHTTHYSIGCGTKLAIEDAIALAETVGQHRDLLIALKSYQGQRQAGLVPYQCDARRSAPWLENISCCIDLKSRQFSTLLHNRRPPLLPHTSHQFRYPDFPVKDKIAILREISRKSRPMAEMGHDRGRPFETSYRSAITIAPSESDNN
jgi:2-polyprenyl-6-methoxyphenol hydroxylase-like FAD-dependent oxidoreductase